MLQAVNSNVSLFHQKFLFLWKESTCPKSSDYVLLVVKQINLCLHATISNPENWYLDHCILLIGGHVILETPDN